MTKVGRHLSHVLSRRRRILLGSDNAGPQPLILSRLSIVGLRKFSMWAECRPGKCDSIQGRTEALCRADRRSKVARKMSLLSRLVLASGAGSKTAMTLDWVISLSPMSHLRQRRKQAAQKEFRPVMARLLSRAKLLIRNAEAALSMRLFTRT